MRGRERPFWTFNLSPGKITKSKTLWVRGHFVVFISKFFFLKIWVIFSFCFNLKKSEWFWDFGIFRGRLFLIFHKNTLGKRPFLVVVFIWKKINDLVISRGRINFKIKSTKWPLTHQVFDFGIFRGRIKVQMAPHDL